MKINFTQVIKDLEGKDMPTYKQDGVDETGKAKVVVDKPQTTLRHFCTNALLGSFKGEEQLEATKKITRFRLAEKITTQDEVDLTTAEISEIQELVNKAYSSPLIVARVHDLLEKKEEVKEEVKA